MASVSTMDTIDLFYNTYINSLPNVTGIDLGTRVWPAVDTAYTQLVYAKSGRSHTGRIIETIEDIDAELKYIADKDAQCFNELKNTGYEGARKVIDMNMQTYTAIMTILYEKLAEMEKSENDLIALQIAELDDEPVNEPVDDEWARTMALIEEEDRLNAQFEADRKLAMELQEQF